MRTVLQKLYRRAWPTRWGPIPLLTATLLSLISMTGFAQTTIVGPLNGGNFELGGTFAANNWTVVNNVPVNPTNQWALNTTPTGLNFTGNRAFISNDGGVTYAYTNTGDSRVHFYRDVTFPAGETIITLSFVVRCTGEGGYDGLNVGLYPTSTTVTSSNATGGGTHVSLLPYYSGGVTIGTSPQYSGIGGTDGVTVTIQIPASFAGTTQRLIFTWRNDTSVGTNPPAAVDDILLQSAAPANFNSSAQGGLWSSPATWAGGVVPAAGNDITIVAGSHVMLDQAISYRHMTVNGNFSYATNNTITLTGDFTVGATGRAHLSTAAVGAIGTLSLEGNFVNNGYVNATACNISWPVSATLTVVGNRSISGTGTFYGVGGRGVIRQIQAQNLGNFTINTTQNLTANAQLVHTANTLVTNGKLRIDNSSSVIDNEVKFAVVTNMGAGYTTAPVAFGTTVAPWTASGAAVAGTRYYSGNNVYQCVVSGTFDVTAPTNTTPVLETNGTADVIWIGLLGSIGNPLLFTAASALGTQYFCGNNLYTCVVAGTASAAAPPVHTSGVVASGSASFAYVGTVARISLNYDGTNNVVRSANMIQNGTGYASTPAIVITNTGAGAGAVVAASMWNLLGATAAAGAKASASGFTGAVDIYSSAGPVGAGVGSVVTLRGGYYNSAPAVGFSAPTRVNLVQNQGAGYTSVPTITVSGGTLITGGAFVSADFSINVAEGRIISVYCNTTTKIYSAPPTLTITGGGGAGATLAWGPGDAAWPTATANLNANGQVDSYTITNEGYGYASTATPTCALSAPALGEASAGTPTSRLMVYTGQQGFFFPQGTNPYNTFGAMMPTNNRIAAITSSSGLSLGANTEVYADAPLTLTSLIDLGGFTLTASSYTYAGVVPTVSGYLFNGSIQLTLPGGQTSATRTFPLGGGTGAARYGVYVSGAGASVATGGYTFTGIRATTTGAPSGSVNPAGNMTGSRGMRLQMQGSGSLSNTNAARTFQLFWNAADNLISDNPSIFLAEGGALTGPWNIRSVTTGTGALPATGSRTTATGAPGPISNSADYFFGFANNGFAVPPGLAYNVSRLTGQTYQSIGPVALGGDNTGTTTTFGSGDDGISPVISLVDGLNAFTYQGQTVTGFRISTNGNIQLQTAGGATGSTQWANSFVDAALLNVVAPFWDDLTAQPNTIAGAQANIRYKITGAAPNRVVIVDWANMTPFGLPGPQLYFQVVMTEATNEIRFNYGDMQCYNGTQNVRYTTSLGLKGRYISSQPSAGQVFANLYENTDKFSHEQCQLGNYGANALAISPEPRSSYVFTPGVYGGYTIPTPAAPSNDNAGGAILRPALSAFPNNIAWDNGTNTTNLYSTRFATHSPQAVCGGGPATNKDVWFRFVASEVNTTVRVYSSGGYVARVQAFDNALSTSLGCNVGTAGSQVDLALTGLTIGLNYYVRVSHDLVGNSGVFTGNAVVNGTVVGVAINDGGTNYTVAATGLGGPTGARMVPSGGGANTFVGGVTGVTAGVITGGGFDGGYGYATVPTVAVESPDWGITGEFGIVIYAPPINDNCDGAIELTNINTNNCVTGQNQLLGIKTSSATPSAETLGACASGADDDLWYKFVATGNSTAVTITGLGSFNAGVQFWSQAAGLCVGKTQLGGGQACLNATGAGGVENINLNTTPGTTYFIRVYHVGTGFGDPLGFDICVTTPVPSCIPAPSSPAVASTTCATPGTVLSWAADPFATSYSVYLDNGPATTLVSTQAGTTYNAGILAAGGYAWRIVPSSPNGAASGCATWTFTVNSPTPLTTTPATRCGTGTVNLAATASGGQVLRWWDAVTGGNLLQYGGSPFTTPIINSTTTYYVSAGAPITDNVGVGAGVATSAATGISPFSNLWEGARSQYLYTAAELTAAGIVPGNINSLGFDVTAVDNTWPYLGYRIRLALTNAPNLAGGFIAPTFTTVYTAPIGGYNPSVGINNFIFGAGFNWDGTSNLVVEVCFGNGTGEWSGNSTVRTTTTAFASTYFTNDDAPDLCTNLGAFGNTSSTIRPNLVLNAQTLCSGPRVAVTATVTAPPAVTASAAPTAICDGASSALLASSSNGGYSYVWNPGALVGAGVNVSPISNTVYTVTATDISGGPNNGCVTTASTGVLVRPLPTAPTVTPAAPDVFCFGPSKLLTATSPPSGATEVLSENFDGAVAGWAITNNHDVVGAVERDWNYRLGSTDGVTPNGYSYGGIPSIPATFRTTQGGRYAIAIADAGSSGNTTRTTLTSPVFSTVGMTGLNLTFQHFFQQWAADVFVGVEISADGGTTWDPGPLVTYVTNQGSLATPANANIAIPGAYNNQPNLRIRFRYESTWGYMWLIDDVKVSGTLSVTGYRWTASAGGSGLPLAATTSSLANANVNFVPNPGAWTFSARSVNVFGCQSAPVPAALMTVHANPTATFNGNSFVCAGQTAPISITLTGAAPWSFQYTNAFGAPVNLPVVNSGANPISESYGPAVIGTVNTFGTSLTDANGCSASGPELGSLTIDVPNPCEIVWNGSQMNGVWADANNWTPNNSAPSSATTVIIPGSVVPQPDIVGVANCAEIKSSKGVIDVALGGTLNVRGNITSLHPISPVQFTGNGGVNLNGTGTQTISGAGGVNFSNLNLGNSSTGGIVVSPGSTVRIISTGANNGIVTVSNSAKLTNNGRFILTSSPSGTARIGAIPTVFPNTATISGDITMERWLPRNLTPGTPGSWYFTGSPISGKNFTDYVDNFKVVGLNSGFGVQGSGIINSHEPERSTIFKYVESTHGTRLDTVQKNGWRIPGNENIAPGNGYRVWIDYYSNGSHKLDNSGSLVMGDVTFPTLTRNHFAPCFPTTPTVGVAWCDEGNRGWNLLSNPYPCDINWDGAGWTKPTELNNAFFVWDAVQNAYFGYAGLGGDLMGNTAIGHANPNIIPSSQAFFVRVNPVGSYSMSISEAAKTTSVPGSFVRSSVLASNKLKVHFTRPLDTDNYRYTSIVWFNEEGSDAFDAHYDVHNLAGSRPYAAFPAAGEMFVRNTLGALTETKIVPMYVNYMDNGGNYRFSFEDLNSFDAGTVVYLRDNFLNVLHDLSAGDYNYVVNMTDGSSASNRFELVFNPNSVTATIKPVEGTSVIVMPNPSNQGVTPIVDITGFDAEKASISIVDALGRNIFNTTVELKNGAARYELKEGFASGVYMINTVGGSKRIQQKLVIR